MKILVSGLDWMGGSASSIKTGMEEILLSAETEVLAVSYRISTAADEFFGSIEQCLIRGVRVILIINRFQSTDHQIIHFKINAMKAQFHRFKVYDYDDPDSDLHSKLILVDRSKALVGSANISKNGLALNHELALLVENSDEVAEIGRVVDKLFDSNHLKLT